MKHGVTRAEGKTVRKNQEGKGEGLHMESEEKVRMTERRETRNPLLLSKQRNLTGQRWDRLGVPK
jgi:hypothetical protein